MFSPVNGVVCIIQRYQPFGCNALELWPGWLAALAAGATWSSGQVGSGADLLQAMVVQQLSHRLGLLMAMLEQQPTACA